MPDGPHRPRRSSKRYLPRVDVAGQSTLDRGAPGIRTEAADQRNGRHMYRCARQVMIRGGDRVFLPQEVLHHRPVIAGVSLWVDRVHRTVDGIAVGKLAIDLREELIRATDERHRADDISKPAADRLHQARRRGPAANREAPALRADEDAGYRES